ncbi:MAG: hypothetical protein IJ836_00015 [Spirochaetales bacterium]|nr:hypothetical protein [Spirochaetales bacterium]
MGWFFNKNKSSKPVDSKMIVDASNKINVQVQGGLKMIATMTETSTPKTFGYYHLEMVCVFLGLHASCKTGFYARRGISPSEQPLVEDYFLEKSQCGDVEKRYIKSQIEFYMKLGSIDAILDESLERVRYVLKNGHSYTFGQFASAGPLNLDIFSNDFQAEYLLTSKYHNCIKMGLDRIK